MEMETSPELVYMEQTMLPVALSLSSVICSILAHIRSSVSFPPLFEFKEMPAIVGWL